LTEGFFRDGFEAIMKLVEIYTALPARNTEIERGIKTDIRDKLSVVRLQALLMIF